METRQGLDSDTLDPAGTGMGRLERWGLAALAAFVVLALAGYGTFGRHPEWLASQAAPASRFYRVAYGVFAQGQVWLAGAVLVAVLIRRSGVAWLPAFLALYGVSLGAELLGTTYGIPFGAYRYGSALGAQWLSRVPVVIPLSWFCMAVASFAVTRLLVARGAGWRRAAVASLVLLSWDLSLDPAMSWATKYWFWSESGPYYGMPWLNLAGWYVTGLALMSLLAGLGAERWIDAVSLRFLVAYWLVNLALPVGMNVLAGLSLAVWVALAALAVVAFAAWRRSRRDVSGALGRRLAVERGAA